MLDLSEAKTDLGGMPLIGEKFKLQFSVMKLKDKSKVSIGTPEKLRKVVQKYQNGKLDDKFVMTFDRMKLNGNIESDQTAQVVAINNVSGQIFASEPIDSKNF